jgi:hypothetical protein
MAERTCLLLRRSPGLELGWSTRAAREAATAGDTGVTRYVPLYRARWAHWVGGALPRAQPMPTYFRVSYLLERRAGAGAGAPGLGAGGMAGGLS